MGFLSGKRLLILGLLSNRSIAYGIAKACRDQGAELAFTYQSERVEATDPRPGGRIRLDAGAAMDVAEDAQIAGAVRRDRQAWPDGSMVSSTRSAFAPREAIAGDFIEGATREAFRIAHDVSAYSFVAIARAALPLLEKRRGSLLTLTYLGAVRACRTTTPWAWRRRSSRRACATSPQSLGARGIRVNGISAGPIRRWPLRASRESQDHRLRREQLPAAAKRDDPRRRQRRCLPAVGPGCGRHRRDHLCRQRLQRRDGHPDWPGVKLRSPVLASCDRPLDKHRPVRAAGRRRRMAPACRAKE